MARKDFDEYFTKVSKQYMQLQETLQDISEEVSNGMFDGSRLEQVKQTIKPVKDCYEMLNYIRYLLDMPARKSKRPKYASQNKKLLSQANGYSAERTLQSNKDALDRARNR